MKLADLIDKLDLEEGLDLVVRALDLVQHILDIVKKAAEGKITSEDAHKAFDQLQSQLAANDKLADEALDKKFDTSED